MAARIVKKSFKDWLYEEVEDTFGLTELATHPELEKLNPIPKKPPSPRNQSSAMFFVQTYQSTK